MKKPNLFIVGAPKCGTTAMAYYLSQHPQVFFSQIKEPHFFNTDSSHRYYDNENDYLSLFKDSTDRHKYLAEGSVWYLYSDVAIDNILKFNPNAKFIVMLRNPVDMYFSLHQELLYGGTENVHSPLTAWNLQDERLNGKNIPVGCSDERFLQYRESCLLGKQVGRVIDKFNKDNLKFITLEELIKDTNTAYLDVLKFLGLEEVGLVKYDIVNEKKVRKSYVLANILKYINYFKQSVGIKNGLGIANKINRLNSHSGVAISKESDKAQLKPILEEYFANDILLLEKLIGKDLNSWKNFQSNKEMNL